LQDALAEKDVVHVCIPWKHSRHVRMTDGAREALRSGELSIPRVVLSGADR